MPPRPCLVAPLIPGCAPRPQTGEPTPYFDLIINRLTTDTLLQEPFLAGPRG